MQSFSLWVHVWPHATISDLREAKRGLTRLNLGQVSSTKMLQKGKEKKYDVIFDHPCDVIDKPDVKHTKNLSKRMFVLCQKIENAMAIYTLKQKSSFSFLSKSKCHLLEYLEVTNSPCSKQLCTWTIFAQQFLIWHGYAQYFQPKGMKVNKTTSSISTSPPMISRGF